MSTWVGIHHTFRFTTADHMATGENLQGYDQSEAWRVEEMQGKWEVQEELAHTRTVVPKDEFHRIEMEKFPIQPEETIEAQRSLYIAEAGDELLLPKKRCTR